MAFLGFNQFDLYQNFYGLEPSFPANPQRVLVRYAPRPYPPTPSSNQACNAPTKLP